MQRLCRVGQDDGVAIVHMGDGYGEAIKISRQSIRSVNRTVGGAFVTLLMRIRIGAGYELQGRRSPSCEVSDHDRVFVSVEVKVVLRCNFYSVLDCVAFFIII